ncbi:MAG: 50S ribosomal protein L22 [bacterium]|nr:50S ribosomal protein L22 [bacterium]
MEGTAHQKYVRASPKKLRRFVADIRGKNVLMAESILRLSSSPTVDHVAKAIHSAASNLRNKMGVDAPEFENIIISEIRIDSAPMWKRLKFRARGKADLMMKRNAHITIKVVESPYSIKMREKQTGVKDKVAPVVAKPKKALPGKEKAAPKTAKSEVIVPKKEHTVKKTDAPSAAAPQKRKVFRTPKGK